MSGLIYTLCALTAFLCALLLLKAHRSSGYKLLLWSSMCFIGLTFSNVLLVIDKVFLPTTIDLSVARYLITFVSMMVLLYGLIMDTD